MSTPAPVSFDDEPLILVNSDDVEQGFAPKLDCHVGRGRLHRALSVFLFNSKGQVGIQQRAAGKMLWPGIWSNSCCSHPRRGEATPAAAKRRLREELGVEADVEFVFKFEYQAPYGEVGTEHELCWVFLAKSDAEVITHPDEVSGWRWMSRAEVDRALREQPDAYSPWFKMEWARLSGEFAATLARYGS